MCTPKPSNQLLSMLYYSFMYFVSFFEFIPAVFFMHRKPFHVCTAHLPLPSPPGEDHKSLLASRLLHQLANLARQILGLSLSRSLSIHPHRVLRPTRPRKAPPLPHLLHLVINLLLQTLRTRQLALSIRRLEDRAILNEDLEQSVR